MTTPLVESSRLVEAVDGPTGKRMLIHLIDPGQGSSGYYSPEVLEAAAKTRVFPKGTQMFINHQTRSEKADRVYGERSMTDLAATLSEDARWDGERLVAEADVFGPWRPVLVEMKDHIGVSIRAHGTAETVELNGVPTVMVKSIDYAESVDFVAAAGRGGKIAALIESARPLVEAHGMSANDLSRILSDCIRDEFKGEGRYAWVCDYGDDYVIYDLDGKDVKNPGQFRRGYSMNSDGTASLTGEPVEVRVRTTYVPVAPAADPVTETATPKEAPVAENDNGAPPAGGGSTDTPVDMTEAANRATARVGELETQLAEARENAKLASNQSVQLAEANRLLRDAHIRIARLEGAEGARFEVAEAFKKASLPAAALARVTAAVVGLNGNALPMVEGQVDRTKLKTAIDAQILSESEYVASISVANGAGTPRGMGASNDGITEAQAGAALTEAFKGLGFDDDIAAVAAKGR